MKNVISKFLVISLLSLSHVAYTQVPQAFKYQSIIRNVAGNPMANTSISIRATIHEGSASGFIAYQESHDVTTNQFGLVNLEIGNGTASTGIFPDIQWVSNTKWMEIEADFGNGFISMGSSQLLSVPFALNFVPGPPGTNGVDGLNGATGLTGLSGTNGIDGADGLNGSNGVDGLNGATGLTGLPGTNGIDGADGLNGSNGVDGLNGATGLTGLPGTNGIDGADGLNGSNGVDGLNGADGATGATGSISTFAMFFGLTAGVGNGAGTDYATTIAVKTVPGTGRISFPQNGPAAGIVRINTSSFTLPDIGTYQITVRIHTTEMGQIQLELNDVDLVETVISNMNPTAGGHVIGGTFFVTTTGLNSILAIVNASGNAAALTITPANGAQTHANAQVLTIVKIF